MANDSPLDELVRWYAAHCDGDWEHQQGISIDTLDNPGWRLKVDLTDTELESVTFQVVEHNLDDNVSWWRCWREDSAFHAACGPTDLQSVVGIFIKWAKASAGT
jgi:hypothetical protein